MVLTIASKPVSPFIYETCLLIVTPMLHRPILPPLLKLRNPAPLLYNSRSSTSLYGPPAPTRFPQRGHRTVLRIYYCMLMALVCPHIWCSLPCCVVICTPDYVPYRDPLSPSLWMLAFIACSLLVPPWQYSVKYVVYCGYICLVPTAESWSIFSF